MQDWQILRRYVEQGSQAAFAELVERHLKMVYATCLRELDDPTLAEDATQAVFLLLDHKASALRPNAPLAAWLFQAARLVAKSARRQETRRRRREQRAIQEMAAEQDRPQESALWEQVEPFLNDALSALAARDRAAILLRFSEGNSLAETGAALGVTEDAARMRVTRAVEKLRRHLAKQGVVVPAAAAAGLLSDPASRATAVPSSVLLLRTALSNGDPPARPYELIQGALKQMRMARLKLTATVAGVGLVGLAAFPLITHAVTPGLRPLTPQVVRPLLPHPSPAPPGRAPREVETTVYFVDVQGRGVLEKAMRGRTGARAPGPLLESLRKASAFITKAPTIRTLEDTSGKVTQTTQASGSAVLGGSPEKNNVSTITTLETKPHVNPDGSLTLTLTVSQTEADPQGPRQQSGSNVSTLRTIRSGEAVVLGGIGTTPTTPGKHPSAAPGTPGPMEHFILLTATLVPEEHSPQATPAPRT